MPTSLFDSGITNATPGVAWLATTPPILQLSGTAQIVSGGTLSQVANERVDAEFIVGGGAAYVVVFAFPTNGRMSLRLATAATGEGDPPGPQLTDFAESNLGIAIQLVYADTTDPNHGAEYSWDLETLTGSDPTEPYSFSPTSVTNAGQTNDAAFRTALLGASQVKSILVNRSHDRIDWDNLQLIEAPAAPDAPAVTSTGQTSLSATFAAATSGDASDSLDLRFRVQGAATWTERTGVTSPYAITGLTAGTTYEVQARGVNAGGAGNWSQSGTATTDGTGTPLALSNFVTPEGHTLIDAGLLEGGTGNFIYHDDDDSVAEASDTGTLVDGSLFPSAGARITRIRRHQANSFLLNDTPNPFDLAAFFAAGGAGNDIVIHVQDSQGAASFAAGSTTVFSSGNNWVRWVVPDAVETIAARITQGSRFILAFTRPTPDLMPTFGTATIANQIYKVDTAITQLDLPAATGGDGTLTYRLTPALPTGLTLSGSSISGTPTTAQAATRYTWEVEDQDGDTDELTFSILVSDLVVRITQPTGDITVDPGTRVQLRATVSGNDAPLTGAGSGSFFWSVDKLLSSDPNPGSPVVPDEDNDPTSGYWDANSPEFETLYQLNATFVEPDFEEAEDTLDITVRGTSTTVPQQPTNVDFMPGSTSITVSWEAPTSGPEPTSYELRFGQDIAGQRVQYSAVETVTSPHTISGLMEKTNYAVQLRSRRASHVSEWFNSGSIQTSAAIPNPPINVAASATAGTRSDGMNVTNAFNITWDEPTSGEPPHNYDIDYRPEGESAWTEIRDLPNSPHSYLTVQLLYFYFYEIRMRSTSTGGPSAWTDPIVVRSLTMAGTAPGAVQNLAVTPTGSRTIHAEWDAPTTGGTVTRYRVLYGLLGQDPLGVFIQTGTELDLSGLEPNTAYYVQVFAQNDSGGNLGESANATTWLAQAPAVPAAPTVRAVDHDSISVSWGDVAQATGYDLQYRTGSDAWVLLEDRTSPEEIDGLNNSTTYEVQVRAKNPDGTSNWSSSGTATTSGAPAPNNVENLTASATGPTTVTAMWDAPSSGTTPTGYHVSWRIGLGQFAPTQETTDTSYPISGLMPDTTYEVWVRAVAGTVNGDWETVEVTTTAADADIVVTLPIRADERVFGSLSATAVTFFRIVAETDNPAGNALTYVWTQTGGIVINQNPANPWCYASMPPETGSEQTATLTLTATDSVTGATGTATMTFRVQPALPSTSLFHTANSPADTEGIEWWRWPQTQGYSDDSVGLIDSRNLWTRANAQIPTALIEGGAEAYVSLIQFLADGGMRLHLAATADDTTHGDEVGPEFTAAAEMNLGLAWRLPDGTTGQVALADLIGDDSADPYNWSAAAVAAAGVTNNAAFREMLLNFWNARLVLVDRTNENIDWPNLSLASTMPPVVPVTPAVQLAPPAVLDGPPIVVALDSYSALGGGLRAVVNSYRHIILGGAESAEIAVAGPAQGLLSLLHRIRHPVRILAARAGEVWTGYVHRVEVELGSLRLAVSVDGMRTAAAAEYTRPEMEFEGPVQIRTSVMPQGPQAGYYGRIETLLQAESPEEGNDPAFAAAQVADFLEPARAITQSGDGAVGATLFCRGWATALQTTLAPRYAPPSRTDVPPLDFFSVPHAYTYLALDSSVEEVALWLPLAETASYALYAASVRLWLVRSEGYDGPWEAALSSSLASYPAESNWVEVSTSNLPRSRGGGTNHLPTGNPKLTEIDFSADPHLIAPGTGGVYLFLRVPSGTIGGFQGAQYARSEPYAAQSLWRRDSMTDPWTEVSGNESNEFDAAKARPAYDIFLHSDFAGLLQFVAQASDVVVAAGQPERVDGAGTYPLYLEGLTTIASVLSAGERSERSGWLVDSTRAIRAVALDRRVYHLSPSGRWGEPVARGSVEMLGQLVAYGGEMRTVESVDFQPRIGQWRLGFRDLLADAELSLGTGAGTAIAREGP